MSISLKFAITTFIVLAMRLSCVPVWGQAPVTALAFAPDETRVAAASQSGIAIRNWPELQAITSLNVDISNIHDLAFSPDGRHLLVAGGTPSEHGELCVVSWPTLEVLAKSVAHQDSIHSAAWLSNSRFVTVAVDNEFIVWQFDGRVAKKVVEFAGHSRSVLCVEPLRENDLFVTAGIDQMLRVWPADMTNKKPPQPIRHLDNHTGAVCDLALRPGQQPLPMLASASVDKTVRLWQPTIGRMVKFSRLPVEPTCLDWTRDGSLLATGCADGKLRIINPDTVQIVQTLPGIDGWIHSVAAATDGSFVVGGTAGQVTRVSIRSDPSP